MDDELAERLRAIFVEELGEQVQQLNEHLLTLERAPDDRDALRDVFRVMHTLKGAARAAGVLPVEGLCHRLEGDLARARDSGTALGGAAIALLFEAADALGDAGERLAAGTPLEGGPLDVVMLHARGQVDGGVAATGPAALSPRGVPQRGGVERDAAATPPPPAAPPRSAPAERPPPAPPAASAPPLPVQVPAATHADRDRDELVRVGLQHVDGIAGAAGEVASLSASLTERAEDLAALRQQLRVRRALPDLRDDAALEQIDRGITRVLRRTGEEARTLGTVSGRLTETARRLRQRSLRVLTETLPRVVRDVAQEVARPARLVVTGEEVEADRVVVEALREPLLHLVRNAVDHGFEHGDERAAAGKPAEGTITVAFSVRGDRMRVAIGDDGRGLDLAAIRHALAQRGRPVPADDLALQRTVFDDGFSTREQATTLSGRGVGLGIVRAAVERVGGTVTLVSIPGQGTTFTLEVPLSIATLRAVTVAAEDSLFAIPSAYVVRVDRLDARRVARVDGRAVVTGTGAPTPLATLAALLGPPFVERPLADVLQVVTVEVAGRRLALVVDDLRDERELVVRPLEHVGAAGALAVGAAIVADDAVVLVLSAAALLADAGTAAPLPMPDANRIEPATRRILVVDDSITSRTLEQSVLAAAGYDVITAVDGLEGWRTVERGGIALVVSDVEMPHLDGIGLCERIRASARTATLPVILVTSLDRPEERARGLEAGADAYVTKSGFDQEVLLDTVRTLLGAAARSAT